MKEIFDESIRAVLMAKKNGGVPSSSTKNEKKEISNNANTNEKPCCSIYWDKNEKEINKYTINYKLSFKKINYDTLFEDMLITQKERN